MDISILLATYKRSSELEKTIERFTQLDHNGLLWQIIVVDNANDAKTKDIVNKFTKSLPIAYKLCETKGKSRALNVGLPLCSGEIIILTDDDVLPQGDWLKETLAGAKRWPKHSVFGGRVIPDRPEAIPDEFKKLRNYLTDYAIADWALPEGPYSVYQVFGPNFAIRKSILKEGVLFNPNVGVGAIFPTGVETFFLLDLYKKGYAPVYLPRSVVRHQIRPEQVTLPWIYRRSFLGGRTDIYETKDTQITKIFGIYRYLYKKFISDVIIYALSLFSQNTVSKIEKRRQLSRTMGQINQCWIMAHAKE